MLFWSQPQIKVSFPQIEVGLNISEKRRRGSCSSTCTFHQYSLESKLLYPCQCRTAPLFSRSDGTTEIFSFNMRFFQDILAVIVLLLIYLRILKRHSTWRYFSITKGITSTHVTCTKNTVFGDLLSLTLVPPEIITLRTKQSKTPQQLPISLCYSSCIT